MDTATTDVDLLREEIATLRKEMEVLRATSPKAADSPVAEKADDDEAPQSNRRGFLKLAGAAAAGATVAAVAGSAQQAAALNGDAVKAGQSVAATGIADETVIYNPSASNLMPSTFRVNNWTVGSLTLPTTHRIAMSA
ncbi:MAG: twin-arginine translocation signal domain-containing protein, partial [Ilumatobacteraceae bacterium]